MSGPRSIVRLHEVRLDGATRALAAARAATALAERVRADADADVARTGSALADLRSEQCRDLANVDALLALLDRGRADLAAAHEAATGAVETLRDRVEAEAVRRRDVVRARHRHEALVGHVAALERRAARRSEETAQVEIDDVAVRR